MADKQEYLTIKIKKPDAYHSQIIDHCRANARFEMQLAQRMGEDHGASNGLVELAEIFLQIADAVETELKTIIAENRAEGERQRQAAAEEAAAAIAESEAAAAAAEAQAAAELAAAQAKEN